MPQIAFTLISDGSSDRVLLPILRWLLLQHRPEWPIQGQWADLRRMRNPPRGLDDRIREGLLLYPCDLLFVHRDAENQDPPTRKAEIQRALEKLARAGGGDIPAVCVIPVRMTEAWLLFDESAIRSAAGNPGGTTPLDLPLLQRVESIPDPKSLLADVLKRASDLSGRRMSNFERRLGICVHLIAERIADFRPLRALPAFQALENDVTQLLGEKWG